MPTPIRTIEEIIKEMEENFFPMKDKTMLRYVIVKVWEASAKASREEAIPKIKEIQENLKTISEKLNMLLYDSHQGIIDCEEMINSLREDNPQAK